MRITKGKQNERRHSKGIKIMKLDSKFTKRFLVYIAGLFIMSVGSNLFLKAALGVAPSCTIALVLTEICPKGEYAVFNFIVNSLLLICEIAVEKKLSARHAVQLGLTFVYSVFIQLTALPLNWIDVELLPGRVVLSFAACAVLALGVSFTINSGFAVLPMEGFVSSLSKKMGKDFGTVRVFVEVLMTAFSALFSVLVLHNLAAVGIGTVIAAFCSGMITHFITKLINNAAAKHPRLAF